MSKQEIHSSAFEQRKEESNYLRGSIKESLKDSLTGALRPEDQFLIKFHGTYQQQNRDLEEERQKQKLEPLYSFLIRVRVPAGIASPAQWLAMDKLADEYGDKTLKLTTRQAFQFHGVLKRHLKSTIAGINQSLLDTLAACGDVNRNVMSSANPFESVIHAEVSADASQVSTHLSPQTGAYHEIWLDDQLVAGGEKDEEPLYGKVYLPRKFKIAFAIPPRNDTDVLTNDLGFIAIVENGSLVGYNLTVGGGMALTFGEQATYARLADVAGFISRENVVEAAEAVLVFQRDHGNRSDRKNARLKYTIAKFGLDYFRDELKRTHGIELETSRNYQFETSGDRYGWIRGNDGFWHYGFFVEGGKLVGNSKATLREIARVHDGSFILTGNQNLVIAQVTDKVKPKIEKILNNFQHSDGASYSMLRQHSIACAALPHCSLAFAEAERYLPSLIDKMDAILAENNLLQEAIVIRMTGCPNGCGRPFMAEIGLVGRAPGFYNLYLGGGFTGNRLNKLYKEMLNEDQILLAIEPLLKDYAHSKNKGEHFGDFIIRKQIV